MSTKRIFVGPLTPPMFDRDSGSRRLMDFLEFMLEPVGRSPSCPRTGCASLATRKRYRGVASRLSMARRNQWKT